MARFTVPNQHYFHQWKSLSALVGLLERTALENLRCPTAWCAPLLCKAPPDVLRMGNTESSRAFSSEIYTWGTYEAHRFHSWCANDLFKNCFGPSIWITGWHTKLACFDLIGIDQRGIVGPGPDCLTNEILWVWGFNREQLKRSNQMLRHLS